MRGSFDFLSRILLTLVFSCLLGACITPQHGYSANYPLTSIYSAVESAMTMGIQGYSQNHREFYSRPFVVKQDDVALKSGLHERGVAKVTILGDVRPYTIDAEVRVERSKISEKKRPLVDGDYSYNRTDKRLASKLLTNIMSILERRERDKNIIDDFRSF